LPLDDGDAGLGESVSDLGFAEARGVVFEGEGFAGVIHVEAAQAIEIREFAEALELFVAQGREEFVADFEKRHAGNYSRSGEWAGVKGRKFKAQSSKLKVQG
jgi:hypothetical protein